VWTPLTPPRCPLLGWSAKTLWSQISMPVLTHYYSDNMAQCFWYRLIHSVSRTLSLCVCVCVYTYVFTCTLHVISVYSAHVCRNTDAVRLSAVLVLWCLHSGFAFLCLLCSRQFEHVCVYVCVSVCVCVCASAKEWDFDLTAKLTTASEWCQKEAKEVPFSVCVHAYILVLRLIWTN